MFLSARLRRQQNPAAWRPDAGSRTAGDATGTGPGHELAYWPPQPLAGMLTSRTFVNALGARLISPRNSTSGHWQVGSRRLGPPVGPGLLANKPASGIRRTDWSIGG